MNGEIKRINQLKYIFNEFKQYVDNNDNIP